ncbi:extracellular alkaline serine protease [Planococcus antarcticus DSM 14505]|uniref:Extracellular alkaline serine protease n=1 Tax=Planococcus antarcticus DSM 14505 TaxID=1185653 RepID=A0AA87IPJ0_9BACL|nr:S8 family serine peptidase [Planococcus antarcticus]EIM07328.1 extracellular alkaline serine protease [Planococcus antarcticus DSM 14505]
MKKLSVLAISILLFSGWSSSDASAEAGDALDRVIISFKEEIDYKLLKEMGADIHEEFDAISAVSVTLPDETTIQAASHDSSIEYIEENSVVRAAAQTTTWGYRTIKANTATSLGYTGKGVKIAIIDSGINSKHPDLKVAGGVSKVANSSAFTDGNGHGTHVAGVIGAQNNSIGIVGVAPDSQLYSVKVLSANGIGTLEGVVAGIQWAIDQKVDIINMSLTTVNNDQTLRDITKKAYEAGILIVAASGNERESGLYSDVLYPARFPSVIAVGSVSQLNKLSYFSNYGASQELVAPGENILSSFVDSLSTSQDDYAISEGTSVASPFAAGTFAQYMEAYPHLSNKQLRETVKRAATDLGAKGRDNQYGNGLIKSLQTKAALFPDLKNDFWYSEPIKKIFDRQIITGLPDGTYRPNATITRAEAVTMLGRALKLDKTNKNHKFSDVSKDSFAAGYINSAYDLGYIQGVSATKFRPNDPIKRGDMALILQAAYKLKSTQQANFKDVPKSMYYYDAIQAAFSNNAVTGYNDNTFRPQNPITRAENAQFLSKLVK